MLNKNELVALAKVVAKAKPSATVSYSYGDKQFSYEVLNETLRKELNEYAGTYRDFEINKNLIYAVIEETLDEVLPMKVTEAYSSFAEVKTFAQGDKPEFKKNVSNNKRAKQFITRVGLEGVYETFKLGKAETVEVKTSAIGGAAQIGLEEFLDGRADMAELLNIIMEGMDELIYREVAQALIAGINQLPAANKHAAAGFVEADFDRVLNTVSAYGTPVIYCTYEFAVKLLPDSAWVSDNMKDELHNNGHLGTYKGRRVIILPQTFVDETNTEKVIDPGYCWIIPTGTSNGKPVKIAFEGNTIVKEYDNRDMSREVQVYKKVGIMAFMTSNIGSYIDTELQGTHLA